MKNAKSGTEPVVVSTGTLNRMHDYQSKYYDLKRDGTTTECQRGVYNGIEMALALIESREPHFIF